MLKHMCKSKTKYFYENKYAIFSHRLNKYAIFSLQTELLCSVLMKQLVIVVDGRPPTFLGENQTYFRNNLYGPLSPTKSPNLAHPGVDPTLVWMDPTIVLTESVAVL